MCSANGVFLGHGSKGIKGSDAVTKKLLAPEVRRCLMGEQSQAPRHLPKMIRERVHRDMALASRLLPTECLCDLEQSTNFQPCPHIRETQWKADLGLAVTAPESLGLVS